MSSALRTDRYELTMLEAALVSGIAEHRAAFEVFSRSLPPGRRFGVVAGLGRFLDELEQFRFAEDELAWLASASVVSPSTIEWLASYRFAGSIDAYAEGECYFPSSPVCTVRGTFGECLLLETLLLSVLNFDTAVASAAARVVGAAAGRPVIEMGSRRVHEDAAVAAARAAYLAGFTSTSNLEAGMKYGIPTAGTASHAFTLAYRDERNAFRAQITTAGVGTSLLVDTYDPALGVEAAVAVAREVGAPGPGAIRIDSGVLADEVWRARKQLDELGATSTRIVVSSDLDEYAVAELESAPVDAYGVGTSVATGSKAPTAGFVYKLVAIAERPDADAPLRSVAKRSVHKVTVGGVKRAYRVLDSTGRATDELLFVDDAASGADRFTDPDSSARLLQHRVVDGGVVLDRPSLAESRSRVVQSLDELGSSARDLSPGEPLLHARVVEPG